MTDPRRPIRRTAAAAIFALTTAAAAHAESDALAAPADLRTDLAAFTTVDEEAVRDRTEVAVRCEEVGGVVLKSLQCFDAFGLEIRL
ncbi:hypothetical protein HKCCE2091_08120 [Rhodobacterales bacterium HKCCE2091]|nr:hypothetical protein [Rhodobacterales bacterium HKCCE2091]